MKQLQSRLALATLVTGVLLIAIFTTTALRFRSELREAVHQKIIERDAAVLYLVAEAQLREAEADPSNHAFVSEMLLSAVLKAVRGMRAVVIYDVEGNPLQTSTPTLIQTDLAPDDFARLVSGEHISRYDPSFPLGDYFSDDRAADRTRRAPLLQVLLPLHAGDSGQTVGFVSYFIDARPLAAELGAIDRRLNRQTLQTLGIGSALIVLVLLAACWAIARAQRIIAERNERLTRANFELTLAAKTSALGVIMSHLIHGLQGPVAGLRAVVADHAGEAEDPGSVWQSAATYTERMQSMIHETVALLGDTKTHTRYELSGEELAATIRDRNAAAAVAKGVNLTVSGDFQTSIDSHRGSLTCLIATNLLQNAIEATAPGRHVRAILAQTGDRFTLAVEDEGCGIPAEIRAHLFEPGRTGRIGGTGLGLAISQLLARQIGATLELVDSSLQGTVFRLSVPASSG